MTDAKVAEAERRVAEAREAVRDAEPSFDAWKDAEATLDAAIRAHEVARLLAQGDDNEPVGSDSYMVVVNRLRATVAALREQVAAVTAERDAAMQLHRDLARMMREHDEHSEETE